MHIQTTITLGPDDSVTELSGNVTEMAETILNAVTGGKPKKGDDGGTSDVSTVSLSASGSVGMAVPAPPPSE
jgi:hypothetical protein